MVFLVRAGFRLSLRLVLGADFPAGNALPLGGDLDLDAVGLGLSGRSLSPSGQGEGLQALESKPSKTEFGTVPQAGQLVSLHPAHWAPNRIPRGDVDPPRELGKALSIDFTAGPNIVSVSIYNIRGKSIQERRRFRSRALDLPLSS